MENNQIIDFDVFLEDETPNGSFFINQSEDLDNSLYNSIFHSNEIIPPSSPCFLGLICFLRILTPFTMIFCVLGITSNTSPVFPALRQ